MPSDDAAPPAAFFLDACAHWAAMQVVDGHAAGAGSAAPLVLLGGAALELALQAVLAASGWSAKALEAIGRDLEAAWGAALDCGLMPSRMDELGDLVGTIHSARSTAPGSVLVGRSAVDMAGAVSVIGSLIVDVGEQFETIGTGLR